MAKDKEKKEDVPETNAPTSEPADESVEVAENPQNKMDEIEDAEVISEDQSNSDDRNLQETVADEVEEETNQSDAQTKENYIEDDQDIQSDTHTDASHGETEPASTVLARDKQTSAFVPMLLGGIVSGAIGFGAAYYLFTSNLLTNGVTVAEIQTELSAEIENNADRISQNTTVTKEQDAALQDIVSRLDAHDDQFKHHTDGLATASSLSDALDSLNTRVESIEALAADMSQVIAKLEKRPVAAALSNEVIEAYNSEVSKLMETMAAQRKEVETLLDEANAEKAQTSEMARNTQARITLNAIQTAFNSGQGFAAELEEFSKLSTTPIPSNLLEIAATGVTGLETLSDAFPEAARGAIAAERSGDSYDGTTQSLLGFLKSQVQARSVTPKEGTDADAVLSRAEAALRGGQLEIAVKEVQTLQSPAKEAMKVWQSKAQERLNLIEALNSLSAGVEN